MAIGSGYETYSDSHLMKYNKKELIEIIRMIESNLIGADEALNNQANYFDVENTKSYEKGYNKAIQDYKKEMIEYIQGDEEFTDWQKREMLELNEIVAEQLKGEKDDD